LYQISCKEVAPFTCCFWEGDLFPIAVKAYWPPDQNYEQREVPCLHNIGGCNICIDGQFRFAACQDIKTLKQGAWITPWCPLVLGSCKNCSLICECFSACSEWCNSKPDTKVSAVSDQDELDKLTQAEVTAPQDIAPTKAEDMTNRAVSNAKENTIKLARSFGNGGRDQIGKTKMRDLKPCLGLICCIASINDKFPECLGGFAEVLFLIFNSSCACCTPMVERGDTFTGDVFLCWESRLGCVCPRTLASCQISPPCPCLCCCFDYRIAIPCDGTDVPCILNIFGLNCCFKLRPTCACTWYAPLGMFLEDYDGEKLNIFQQIGNFFRGPDADVPEAKLVVTSGAKTA
jgi:hypothetical protein